MLRRVVYCAGTKHGKMAFSCLLISSQRCLALHDALRCLLMELFPDKTLCKGLAQLQRLKLGFG